MKTACLFTVSIAAALVGSACQERAPTNVTAGLNPPALDVSDEHQAEVVILERFCILIDGDFNFVGPFDAMGVITQSPEGNWLANCHGQGANSTGRAVHYIGGVTRGPLGRLIPCAIPDGSGGFLRTFRWRETVSASGEINLTCHGPTTL